MKLTKFILIILTYMLLICFHDKHDTSHQYGIKMVNISWYLVILFIYLYIHNRLAFKVQHLEKVYIFLMVINYCDDLFTY